MTVRKKFKQLVRRRMEKTGECYTTARRHTLAQGHRAKLTATAPSHFPGNVPATTALRVLLTHAGLRGPGGQALSEAMLFGLAGGIGVGVFQFYYEKEDVGTFFLGGRALWHDDLDYARTLLAELGIEPRVTETSGPAKAERQLREALAQGGPVMTWVDAEGLPHRAMPGGMGAGSYHVVTVYGIEDDQAIAWIGDCADRPVSIPLKDLAAARGRIRKQKHRLLWIPEIPPTVLTTAELERLALRGLQRCGELLEEPRMQQMAENFRLNALETWADRLHDTRAAKNRKASWARVFGSDANLWRALTWLYDSVEHYGTGGGLCRPLMADFLGEAARLLDRPPLGQLGGLYRRLGHLWSDLARAALPEEIELLFQGRQLLAAKAELLEDGAPASELSTAWQRLEKHREKLLVDFPLSEVDREALFSDLKWRVLEIHQLEVEALDGLRAVAG